MKTRTLNAFGFFFNPHQMNGIIFDLKRFAVHDGPGIRTTVFLKGCPLACSWCHNPEGISACMEKMPKTIRIGTLEFTEEEQVGRDTDDRKLMEELLKDRIFWEESGGGVTFSGGEPLMQFDFLKSLLQACRKESIHTAVDTSGFVPTNVWQDMLPWADLYLFDLKIMDEKRHQQFTGVSNKLILQNLILLSKRDIPYRIRIPLIPDVTATNNNLQQVLQLLGTLDSPPQGVDLLPFHRTAQHKYERLGRGNLFYDMRLLSENELTAAKDLFTEHGYSVQIGG
jgi:pyruvate formate lyase activating enzyme